MAQVCNKVLPEFVPITSLWEGDGASFPSEQSCRWALRQHRAALVESKALALFRGRIFVHPARLASVIETESIRALERRLA